MHTTFTAGNSGRWCFFRVHLLSGERRSPDLWLAQDCFPGENPGPEHQIARIGMISSCICVQRGVQYNCQLNRRELVLQAERKV